MNPGNFVFFLTVLGGALVIARWSAQRSSTTYRFYSASGRLTGFQNGLAVAGDFVSAASFLGVTGAIALYGFDGALYAIGFLCSFFLLWFVAPQVHQLGRYTLAQVVCTRFPSTSVRVLTALNTVGICVWYMVPQLMAAGVLMRLLLGLDYSAAVLITGTMMTVYVIFGGMVTTSWIQIIKTTLLLATVIMLTLIVLARFHWSLLAGYHALAARNPYGTDFFAPGHLFRTPLDRVSLVMSLVLGTAGLPHILVRFFTVRSTRAVRQSILTATGTIGLFYFLSLFLGVGAVALIGWQKLRTLDPTGNLAVPLLARVVGGQFVTAFIVAIAFATILAVVTGLLLTATAALSHDLFSQQQRRLTSDGEHGIGSVASVRYEPETDRRQLRSARATAAGVGSLAILISLLIRHINVTFPVSLIFVVAAATNLPLLLFTFYWKRFTTQGAITGLLCGMISSTGLSLLDGHLFGLWHVQLPHWAVFQLPNIGLVAIPCGFLGAILGTLLTRQSPIDRERSMEWAKRQTTGPAFAEEGTRGRPDVFPL